MELMLGNDATAEDAAVYRAMSVSRNALAERYCGGRGVIEPVLLGVTGMYGESIYPAGPEGGWTARLTSVSHNHAVWWAGDDHAAAAFRAAMRERYGKATALNRAWGAAAPSFDAVRPFLPAEVPSDRARADFVEWYQRAMTEWCVTWARAVRVHFPATPIYLQIGGAGDPMLGADFTAQAKAMAPFGIGIRITNDDSDNAANFTLRREVATATHAYGAFCGFELGAGVTAVGNVACILNASASGARQLHADPDNVLTGKQLSKPLAVPDGSGSCDKEHLNRRSELPRVCGNGGICLCGRWPRLSFLGTL